MEQTQPFNQAALLDVAFQAVRIYAETHPRPLHVTLEQAAEMLGITVESLMKMMSSKKLRINECGLIPIGDIDRALASRASRPGVELQKAAAKKASPVREGGKTGLDRPRSHSPEHVVIRLAQVEESVGLKKSAIYKMIKTQEFPAPIKLGKHASDWLESSVQTWIRNKAERDPAFLETRGDTSRMGAFLGA
ncbi:helix-turn-helix transcriptional regulator [Rhodocyclus gracilis]|nr:AlpA family phage regulatory protein [Rhodocyclus gracilis]